MSISFNFIKNSLLASGVVFITMTTFAFQSEQAFYRDLSDQSHIRPQYTYRNFEFDMKDTEPGAARSKFNSVPTNYLGVAVHAFDLHAAINLPVDKQKGNLEMRAKLVRQRWGADFLHQRYRSFQRDIADETAQLNNTNLLGYYVFNHRKFSLKAITNQSQRQLRSAGSPILIGLVSRFRIDDGTGLLDSLRSASLDDFQSLTAFDHWMIGLIPGYSYSLVEGNWLVNGTIALGPGHYWQDYELDTELRENVQINMVYRVGMYGGIDSGNYFAGVSFNWEQVGSSNELLHNRFRYYSLTLAFGYRFVEKGIFKRSVSAESLK